MYLSVGGERPSIRGWSDSWYRHPDGSCPGAWDAGLEIELVCQTPIARRVLLCATGSDRPNSTFAVYRPVGESRVVDGTTWVRYARAD